MSVQNGLLLTVLLTFFASPLFAQPPHPWQLLEGSWQFESSNQYQADVTYKLAANGTAAIGEWVDADGGQIAELIGWRPDQKALVSTAFGSGNKYWQFEYTTVSADQCEGAAIFVDPGGAVIRGTVSLEKQTPNLVTGRLQGKTSEGADVSIQVKFTRRNPA